MTTSSTGYRSFSYLRRFSVDIVKIDQSLVADLVGDADARTLVAAISHLAHDLGGSGADGVQWRGGG
ncbi:MAG: EAL domain-containing protein [Cellulomonas sp.]|nr:EAL domain-containing protein [Cellulomonas sp.]